MLHSMDVEYCIVGHSERRLHFHETHQLPAEKVDACLRSGIVPIFCCGEILQEREGGLQFAVVKNQLQESLFHLDESDMHNIVIAYEPVWAIGTGVNATPEQAQEMHAYIRGLIREKYNSQLAESIIILYGGSCNAANAENLFSQPDVDGGLIGGASLKPEEFVSIIRIASSVNR